MMGEASENRATTTHKDVNPRGDLMTRTGQIFHVTTGLIFSFSITAALAQEAAERRYALPDRGSIQLRVPGSWKDELRQPPHKLPPTIVFSQKTGASFQVLLTPLWVANQDGRLYSEEEMRRKVQQAVEGVKSQAIEKTLEIKELKVSSGRGYYFSATDRAGRAGEYKYMMQGIFRVGDLVVAFTVLTNDGQERIVADALTAISSAKHSGD